MLQAPRAKTRAGEVFNSAQRNKSRERKRPVSVRWELSVAGCRLSARKRCIAAVTQEGYVHAKRAGGETPPADAGGTPALPAQALHRGHHPGRLLTRQTVRARGRARHARARRPCHVRPGRPLHFCFVAVRSLVLDASWCRLIGCLGCYSGWSCFSQVARFLACSWSFLASCMPMRFRRLRARISCSVTGLSICGSITET
jgi:hypothetical protein